jgi:hypothetical protein
MSWIKITHDHKVALGILLASGILDISFCAEKLALHYGYQIRPLTWAIIYGTLGSITLIGAIIELLLDIKSDCSKKE